MSSIRTVATARTHDRCPRAMAMFGTVALLALSLGAGVVSAADGRDHRNAENTFTKWIAGFPNMVGVVGGDVGDGTYSGTVLSLVDTATTRTINAIYRFTGSEHAFKALVHVVANGRTVGSTAVLTGVVTDGWLAGRQSRCRPVRADRVRRGSERNLLPGHARRAAGVPGW